MLSKARKRHGRFARNSREQPGIHDASASRDPEAVHHAKGSPGTQSAASAALSPAFDRPSNLLDQPLHPDLRPMAIIADVAEMMTESALVPSNAEDNASTTVGHEPPVTPQDKQDTKSRPVANFPYGLETPKPTDWADKMTESARLDALLARTIEEPVYEGKPEVSTASRDSDDSEEDVVLFMCEIEILNRNQEQCLEVEGTIGPIEIHGFVRSAMLQSRLASPIEKSYNDVVLKNLVAIFQGLILFEDCLTRDAFRDINNMKDPVLAALQAALGFHVRGQGDHQVLTVIEKTYKNARIREILSQLRKNKIPKDPEEPFGALLMQLIDHYIMFEYTGEPLRTAHDHEVGWERVKRRKQTIEHTLSSATERRRLLTDFASMVPCDLHGTSLPRPWTIVGWIQKEKRQESYRYGAMKEKRRGSNDAQDQTGDFGKGDEGDQDAIGSELTAQSSQALGKASEK